MSHLVIVGGSKGIGRDVIPTLEASGHYVTVLQRGATLENYSMYLGRAHRARRIDALFLCQRYRPAEASGGVEWAGELDVSLTISKEIIDWAEWNMGNSSIVVMASVAAVSVEEEQPVGYHACKAALVEMVKYYAVTLGPKQIRVNAIIPGLTIKPEARAFYDAHPELEALYQDIAPIGRMGTVGDIAHLVDFLISDHSSYLTGQTITLDGGISLRSAWALARRVTPALRDVPVTQRAMVAK